MAPGSPTDRKLSSREERRGLDAHDLLLGVTQAGKVRAAITPLQGCSSVNYLNVPEALTYCLAQLKLWGVENNVAINLRV